MTKRSSGPSSLFDRVVLAHPRTVLLCLAVVIGIMGYQGRYFRMDASADMLLLEDDADLHYARQLDSRYGGQEFLVLTYTPKEGVFSPQSLAVLGRLRNELSALKRVDEVQTVLDVPLLNGPATSVDDLTSELPTLESGKVAPATAVASLRGSRLYRNLLLSPDGRTTALLITFLPDNVYDSLVDRRDQLRRTRQEGVLDESGRAELHGVSERLRQYKDVVAQRRREDIVNIREIMDRYRSKAELFLGGVGMIADDMIRFVERDISMFALGIAAVLALVLGFIFRRVRWVVLPLLCCVASAVATIGLLGWLRWDVTVVSCNFLSLQLIIVMAVAIHLVVRYRELLADEPEAPHRQLVDRAVRLKWPPCAYAVLTTLVGFASLLACNMPPVVMLGWTMVVGLTVALIVTFLLLPTVLVLLPKGPPPRLTSRHLSFMGLLARWTENRGGLILGLGAATLLISFAGAARLEVENRFIDYFDPTTEIHQGMKVIDQQLGGTTPLDVIIKFGAPATPDVEPARVDDEFADLEGLDDAVVDANDPQYWFTRSKVDCIRDAHRYLDELSETGKVLSLASTVDLAEQMIGSELESIDLAILYDKTPEAFRAMLIAPYVSVEHNEARLSVRVRDSDRSLRRNELLKRIRKELPASAGLQADQVRLAGLLVLYNNVLQDLFGSQILTLGITMGLLSGMFLVLLRSWRLALIAMAPNVFPVVVVLGMMGWLGLPLDMMTITIAAIGVGIAVDDTIHYLNRFQTEFAIDRLYIPAMHRSHRTVGRAMCYTTVAITIGLSVLSLSQFVPTIRFGLLTALAMIAALFADLTILPAIMVRAKPFGP
ncbi:MAG: MMPL family transporter, partial [Phycisphaerae bacterium]|nr:MMPL family transporter [Phycisphaerae bacterium]